jgi:hypothetical protein
VVEALRVVQTVRDGGTHRPSCVWSGCYDYVGDDVGLRRLDKYGRVRERWYLLFVQSVSGRMLDTGRVFVWAYVFRER